MAPEQLLGQAATIRSDLYALGLVTWELLTGRRAAPGHSLKELARGHREGEPMPASPEGVELDPVVERVVRWCLEKEPRDRPASAEAVEAALVADAGSEPGIFLKTVVVNDLAGGDGADGRERVMRELLAEHGGREISTAEGPVWLFERPWGAVCFALAYRQAREGVAAAARVGVDLGEVSVHRGSRREAAGTGALRAEGPGVAMARRLSELAREGQTLVSAHAFDLARHHSVGEAAPEGKVRWLSHGNYLLRGQEEAIEIFEVGVEGLAPLAAPESSEQATAVLGQGYIPGWRPAPGAAIPQRPHWKIERKLGEGGFGDMWLARHGKTREARVFKFCYDASRLRALHREITIFRLLKEQLGERPDVTRILDWNFDEAPYFLESEYTAAGSLVEWAEEQGGLDRVPLEVRLEIVAQVATALSAAHSVGVLHKDVKPGNVLIAAGEGGAVKAQLSDFGIGAVTDRGRLAAAGITVAGLTERTEPGSGSSLGGTRLYMAPELLEGKPPTLQADIFALGVMLYQMVVGDFPRALAPGWRREADDGILREDPMAPRA
ncbi:MAG: protein kinase [bacterium]|nr:protein kinase [bacterium]